MRLCVMDKTRIRERILPMPLSPGPDCAREPHWSANARSGYESAVRPESALRVSDLTGVDWPKASGRKKRTRGSGLQTRPDGSGEPSHDGKVPAAPRLN